MRFIGTGVALVTPFNKDKSIDYKSLGNLIDHLISNKVEYLVALGTTSEAATLSPKEKKEVLDFIIEKVNSRVPIVMGIGGNNTQSILEDISNNNYDGIDAYLAVAPYYNKPNQRGLYQHFDAIAKISTKPIILYNVPGRTGVNISAETTLKLANSHKNIIAIKEASANFEQIMQIIESKPSHFDVISGDDALTLPLISVGCIGVISVVANLIAKDFSNMVRFALDNKYSEAKNIHYENLEFCKLVFEEGSPAGIKYALYKRGLVKNELRLPLVEITENLEEKLTSWLARSI